MEWFSNDCAMPCLPIKYFMYGTTSLAFKTDRQKLGPNQQKSTQISILTCCTEFLEQVRPLWPLPASWDSYSVGRFWTRDLRVVGPVCSHAASERIWKYFSPIILRLQGWYLRMEGHDGRGFWSLPYSFFSKAPILLPIGKKQPEGCREKFVSVPLGENLLN